MELKEVPQGWTVNFTREREEMDEGREISRGWAVLCNTAVPEAIIVPCGYPSLKM